MNFSLFVMFEGSGELGPVPLCRIADADITREAVSRALDKTAQRARLGGLEYSAVRADICRQEQDLRDILLMI
jgi:hypothetical protein